MIKLYNNSKNQYYTKPEVAKQCIDLIDNILQYELIIEPSAGEGSFSKQLPNCIAYDIDPKKTLVIGNPPFGYKSLLAKAFILKSTLFADTIAFILPLNFHKQLYPKNKYYHLLKLVTLSFYDSFYRKDNIKIRKDYGDCIFQIWVKKDYERLPLIYLTDDFYFIKANLKNADIYMQRTCFAGISQLKRNISNDYKLFLLNNKILSDLCGLLKRSLMLKCNIDKDYVYNILKSKLFNRLLSKYYTTGAFVQATKQGIIRCYNLVKLTL